MVRANRNPLEKEKRNITVDILTVKEELAMVKIVSAIYYDYLQIAKIENE